MSSMSSESDDSDSSNSEVINSFACLTKVKSNTPRARFDVHFHPTSIELIQYSVQKKVSNRYRITEDNIIEMLRLPYSNDKQIFFVLHLKRPIVGGNKATTKYDFVVFNFAQEEHDEIHLDLDNHLVRDMFDEDTIESEAIEGRTVDIFETLVTKVLAKDVTTPATNYNGSNDAPALRCTFWDNDEHFLYPLDDGFVNVWKYCQKLKLKEIKNVRFVRSQGRFKTFDFYIYPRLNRAIRRYHIGASKSNVIDCFFLEFKAIDQDYYDGLFEYCNRNEITISTNDFRESASDTDSNSNDDSEPESRTATETNASESESEVQLIDDGFEAPDPYMARLQSESEEQDSESGSSNESAKTSNDDKSEERSTTSPNNNTDIQRRRRKRSRNVITDSNESSSDGSVAAGSRKRKQSLRIDSDVEVDDDIQSKEGNKKHSLIIDSESE